MSRVGRKPYGHFKSERDVIAIIVRKAQPRKGKKVLGPWQIARELNIEGHRTQTGKLWSGQIIKIILLRAAAGDFEAKDKKRRHKTGLESTDYLTKIQIEKCRQVCSARERVVFEILLCAGLRPSELCTLRVKDLGINSGKSQIDIKKSKRHKARVVDIDEILRAILEKHIEDTRGAAGKNEFVFLNTRGKPMGYQGLYYMVKQLFQKAGFPELKPYSLRHTFATLFLNSSGNLKQLKEQLGHEDYRTTGIYAKSLKTGITESLRLFRREVGCGASKDNTEQTLNASVNASNNKDL